MNEHPIFGKVIHTYTTKEAVADRMLFKVDLKDSKELGINYPVYLTREVYFKYIRVPKGMEAEQDESGRLYDMLFMFVMKVRALRDDNNEIMFEFLCRLKDQGDWESHERLADSTDRQTRIVTLRATVRAQDFDDPSPAIFILKPFED